MTDIWYATFFYFNLETLVENHGLNDEICNAIVKFHFFCSKVIVDHLKAHFFATVNNHLSYATLSAFQAIICPNNCSRFTSPWKKVYALLMKQKKYQAKLLSNLFHFISFSSLILFLGPFYRDIAKSNLIFLSLHLDTEAEAKETPKKWFFK